MLPKLTFDVVGAGTREIDVHYVFNGGYAGRNTEQVQHHIDELAELGVPGPKRIPTLYPLTRTLAVQGTHTQVAHARTSGEAEWALIVGDGPDDLLVTVACDHTDRALEVHGVAWSKQSAPDFLGTVAWDYTAVESAFDDFTLKAWVRHGDTETAIQDGTVGQLLPPRYWVDEMTAAGLLRPGTVVMSGTIPMTPGVDQFADAWRVELSDGAGHTASVAYEVEVLSEPWE